MLGAPVALRLSIVWLVCGCGGTFGLRDAGAVGRFAIGGADLHCGLPDGGVRAQPTRQAACALTAADFDGGLPPEEVPPEPRFGGDGDDDDCKYHLTVSSSAIALNKAVTLGVALMSKVDGAPVLGADVMPQIFLSDDHPAPDTAPMSMESAGGIYSVSPVKFDAPGRWTVRLHLFDQCVDLAEDSPHGHAAFFVDVP